MTAVLGFPGANLVSCFKIVILEKENHPCCFLGFLSFVGAVFLSLSRQLMDKYIDMQLFDVLLVDTLYFAMCNVQLFGQVSEGKIRMCIIHG